ncbi:hypothetical protein ACJJTC_005952 [Scirpophaga incertulas]
MATACREAWLLRVGGIFSKAERICCRHVPALDVQAEIQASLLSARRRQLSWSTDLAITRGEAHRRQKSGDEVVTPDLEESIAEQGRADGRVSAGERPTHEPARQLPTDQFISTLIETIMRTQMEANRTLMTGSNDRFQRRV